MAIPSQKSLTIINLYKTGIKNTKETLATYPFTPHLMTLLPKQNSSVSRLNLRHLNEESSNWLLPSIPRRASNQTVFRKTKNHASLTSTMIGGSSNWWIGGGLESVHSSESASTTFTISSSPSLGGGAVLLRRWAVITAAARGVTALSTGLSATGATLERVERSMVLCKTCLTIVSPTSGWR